MDKSLAIPHAPSKPLPELDEFLKPFQALFRRRESQTAMERYLTGLLTEHPAKNCDTLADIVPGTNEQQLQGLLTQMICARRVESAARADHAHVENRRRRRVDH